MNLSKTFVQNILKKINFNKGTRSFLLYIKYYNALKKKKRKKLSNSILLLFFLFLFYKAFE